MTALLLMTTVLAADPAPAVAFALEIRGTATVERAGKTVDLEEGDPIREGDKLIVPPSGGVTVYFRPSGPVAVLSGPAEAKVQTGKLDTTATVIVRDVKVPARAADGLNRDVKADLIGGLTLRAMAIDTKPVAVHPAPGRAVLAQTPQFEWPAADGSKKYKVEVFQVRPKGARKVWEAEASDTKLPYPEGKNPLPRGERYTWRVTATLPDGSVEQVADAKFAVLDEEQVADLTALVILEKSDRPADWLIAAEAYSGAGLTDEPIRLLKRVAEKRPESALVWAKLAAHYKAAGRADDAKKAKAEVDKLAGKK